MTIPTYLPRIDFRANFSCFIGNHAIVTHEQVYIIEDRDGLWWLYYSGDIEPIARLNKADVNKLAGRNIL